MAHEQLHSRRTSPPRGGTVGTDCTDAGTKLEYLPMLRGYYRISWDSSDLRQCPDFNKGNDSACVGGVGDPCLPWTSGPCAPRPPAGPACSRAAVVAPW